MFAGKRSLVWSALAAVFAMAFWMRLQFIAMYGQPSYLAWAGDHYFGSLSGFYVMAAEAWRRGEPYRELIYPPGYVAFLATVGDVFGTGATTLRTVQAAFDASAVAAVYMIGGAVGLSAPWALAPAAVYAILPLWAASSTFLLAESLAVPLLLWALVLVVISARARSVWMALAAGAWSGLSALVRPDFALVFVPAALILVLVRRERRLIGAAMFCLAFAVAVGSWGVHNRRLHGAWVFTSTGGGASLWEGLGEIENPYGYVLDDSAANHQLIPRGYGWASIDGSAFLTREYLKAWRDHPAFVLRVANGQNPDPVGSSSAAVLRACARVARRFRPDHPRRRSLAGAPQPVGRPPADRLADVRADLHRARPLRTALRALRGGRLRARRRDRVQPACFGGA